MKTPLTSEPLTTAGRSASSAEEHRVQKRLCRLVGQAIADYNMIEGRDKIMVCLSGGKDSFGLLDILRFLRTRAPIQFDIVAVNLDQKQPGFPVHVLPTYLEGLGVPYHIEERDTYSIVKQVVPAGKTTCSLCSRLRRGILYRLASELGATKIALGHHRDDILETLLLNMFYGGKLKAMPPKLLSKDRRHIVIRPLAYVKEADLASYADMRAFPLIPCDLCGSQEDLKRKQVKSLIHDLDRRFPGAAESMFAALSNVLPSHLMDRRLFPFASMNASGAADGEADQGEHASESDHSASGAGMPFPLR